MAHKSPFFEMVRGEIRLRGYSLRTEKTYLFWIYRYIIFHCKRHPSDMGANEVKQFLTWLAVKKGVAVNTQKVALNALVFLYCTAAGYVLLNVSDFAFRISALNVFL